MALKRIKWENGNDVHLLPGNSAALRGTILVEDDTAVAPYSAVAIDASLNLHLAFFGEFQGAPQAHGAKVEPVTGIVSFPTPVPTLPIRNFLVRAELQDASNKPVLDPIWIRIQLHGGLASAGPKIWLTPNSLSIHRLSNGQRFTVLAEFDDGVIGDITDLPGLKWDLANRAADQTKLTIDPNNGGLTGLTDGASVSIKLTPPSTWGGQSITATVNVLPPWGVVADPADLEVTLVAGPGRGAVKDVTNILILPEGFEDIEREDYRRLVGQVVTYLQNDDKTNPFKLLKRRINYWMAWITSPVPGTSILYEVYSFPRGTGLAAGPQAVATKPPNPLVPARRWSLNEMANEVGLPVPADALPVNASDSVVNSRAQAQLTRWASEFGSKVTAARVNTDSFRAWADRADRRLVDELDSGLGLGLGGRPNVEAAMQPQWINWNPRRTQRSHLDAFIKKLTDPGAKAPDQPVDPTIWVTGKDRPFVLALLGGARYGGTQNPDRGKELIAASLDAFKGILIATVSGRRVRHRPVPLPDSPSLHALATVAHETSHAFGLGDEYGTIGRLPAGTTVPELNLQDEASLLDAQGRLDGSKLKWLWPRIRKATILTGAPTASAAFPGLFEIPIPANHEKFFVVDPSKPADDRFVQVRARSLAVTQVSELLEIKQKAAGKLIVGRKGGGTVNPTLKNFPSGSRVYAPLLDAQGNPLLLVHAKVQAHLTQFHQPLNAPKPPTAARKCGDQISDDRDIQQATNLPPTLTVPTGKSGWEMVGAYEGGKDSLCGIYHPAGACLMRTQVFDLGEPDQRILEMCPVCQYILVDQLDPTRHGDLDQWFHRRYPK